MTTLAMATSARTTRAQHHGLARLGTMLRFALRYNWLRLVIWLVLTVGMTAFIGAYYQSLDPQALQDLIQAGGTPGMKALLGWISAAVPGSAPLGAAVWIKGWTFISLMLGIGLVFLVTHNLRADEDVDRTELFRSRPLGLHASLASTLIMTVSLCVIVALGIGASGIRLGFGAQLGTAATTDPDPLGSWIFGLSIGAVGLLGIGIAVLTNELMPSSGGANGLGAGVFGLFYLIRMAGDVKENWLTWISPLGWAEKMDPWGANRAWPLVLIIALALVLIVIGWLIESKRDYGGALVAARLGKADAKKSMTSVWGLALHLQQTAWLAWTVCIVVFSLMLGSVTPLMADMLETAGFQSVDASTTLGAAGFLLAIMALGIGSFTIYSSSTLALDEAHGLLEHQLAGSVSRWRWALQRLAVALVGTLVLLLVTGILYAVAFGAGSDDYSHTGAIIGSMFAYLPSLLLVMGVVILGFGWWPWVAVAVGWAFFGVIWFILILGEALHLPGEVLRSLPFMSASNLPLGDPDWTSLSVTLVVGLLLIVVGLVGFRRRNVPA